MLLVLCSCSFLDYIIFQGCYEALWDLVRDNKSAVIGIFAGLGAFQVK